MDISKANAVNNSGTSTLSANGQTAARAGKASNTLDSDGKAASASPSTIVKLQSKGKADEASSDSNAASTDDNAPSAVKSFTYGVLNLPDPAAEPAPATPQSDNSYFTAGRWAAAAVTVGTLISLVV
ncbi:hypothetical protein [Aquitalea magnusonii]|uniref:Uncharacterized protein n=1 Tax=Aquitalea magnusonii TaxID=332411 RepID=A0A318JQ01_9NEIS|nr:hypothetical protein [Aquitalea magnusonii]PXX46301.1 hypothetical protein DFR38_109143 [Aquitalea magnusonii]